MKKNFLFFIAAVLGVCAFAETPNVTFVNTGKMFIGGSSEMPALYVPDDVRMLDAVNGIKPRISMYRTDEAAPCCAGRWDIGGNFYQDSYGNVFDSVSFPALPGPGGIVFFVDDRGERRYIKPLDTEGIFDRSVSYVNFSAIALATNDTVVIPAKMGINLGATGRFNGTNGCLLLESKEIDGKVYDASLRPTYPDASTGGVFDINGGGSVVVEKWVDTYRGGDQLFGFATPFKNQKSGYFAGNWVRKPEQIASDNKHTQYVYGNKTISGSSSVIAMDQFVRDPSTEFEVGQAYLIKPRPAGFTYQDLIDNGGLPITGAPASAYDKEKFVFDGNVYTLPHYDELLFTDDHLPVYRLDVPTNNKTTNWLMGNSYTCAISIQAIVDSIRASGITFSRSMYVFPFGSQTYQEVKLVSSTDDILTWQADEIPAMSIFMLRLNKNQGTGTTAGAEFKLGKSALVHSLVDYGQTDFRPAPGSSGLNNQVIFRLTTEDNENNFDLAAIGLRINSVLGSDNNDVQKVYMSDYAGFQLYTLAAPDANNNQAKLSANGVPLNVEQVSMNLRPMAHEPKTMILRAKGIETLSSEDFWIEDLKTKTPHYFTNGEPYVFTTDPNDVEERFIVHFKAPKNDEEETIIDEIFTSKLDMYSIGKEIFVENLLSSDIGADAAIYDIAGKLLDTFKVTEAPKMSYITKGLVSGTYVVRLYRTNNVETLKLIIR